MRAAARTFSSWGRPAHAGPQRCVRLDWRDEILPRDSGPLLAHGMGRSYGDSCLNGMGTLIEARGLDRFIDFDRERGVLRCEAGVLLADILRVIVPCGWFLPVTPGTQQVTLGGAIANDVHGKNHHAAGSFGRHVRCFELLRSDGTRRLCSPTENSDWFAATIGGLGLTGLILWAEIELLPVASPAIDVETVRFHHFDEFLHLSHRSARHFQYTVAWIDCLAPVRGGPRGLFFRGNHGDPPALPAPPRTLPGVPLTPPCSLLPPWAMRMFNAAVWHRPRPRRNTVHYQPFFYPLDAVPHWNRLFGPQGFFQYQCVIPDDCARDALMEMLGRVTRARQGSFLAVLKVFGSHEPPGWLSFSRPGITLALDFPDRGTDTRSLLDSLDDITVAAGGAVYPAKDARMNTEVFRRGYPRWRLLERYRDPAFISDFWRRAALGLACRPQAREARSGRALEAQTAR